MYIVRTQVKPSIIDGKGVFAAEKITKGLIVRAYDPKKDLALTQDEFEILDDQKKAWFYHSAYLSPWSGLWICPPEGDDSSYTNHSDNNNLSVEFDEQVSSEPYFIANRDIEIDEEITNNYHEFDSLTRQQKPEWASGAKEL